MKKVMNMDKYTIIPISSLLFPWLSKYFHQITILTIKKAL